MPEIPSKIGDEESPEFMRALSSAAATLMAYHQRVGAIPYFNTETTAQLIRDMCGPAYRAGREDAARELEAEADDEAQRPGRAEPSELVERLLREAARIAREGSSLKRSSEGEGQDTPEGREDQND